MKTKIKLALMAALFAGFGLVSCTETPGKDTYTPFEIPSAGDGRSIEFNVYAFNNDAVPVKSIANIQSFILNASRDEVPVRKANEGDTVWLRANPFSGFDFLQWTAPADVRSLYEPEADVTYFVMPDADVRFDVMFDDMTIPQPSPMDFGATFLNVSNVGKPGGTTMITAPLLNNQLVQDNQNLRNWKKRLFNENKSHVFVWFDAWSGRLNDGSNSMRGLPDEVTIISNWGQPKYGLSAWHQADMRYMQEVKGCKVVFTLFSAKVGEDCGDDASAEDRAMWDAMGTATSDASIREPIARYAKRLFLNCIKEGYDGYDWDFEPTVSGRSTESAPLWRVKEQASMFLEELGYWFGPRAFDPTLDRTANGLGTLRGTLAAMKTLMSNAGLPTDTPLLLLVDGQVADASFDFSATSRPNAAANVSFYVNQAYDGVTTENAVRGRVGQIVNQVDHIFGQVDGFDKQAAVNRSILTANYENTGYRANGGGMLAMASARQFEGYDIGGFGAYRVGLSYDQSMASSDRYESPGWEDKTNEGGKDRSKLYVWLRKGIDLQYGTAAENPRQ